MKNKPVCHILAILLWHVTKRLVAQCLAPYYLPFYRFLQLRLSCRQPDPGLFFFILKEGNKTKLKSRKSNASHFKGATNIEEECENSSDLNAAKCA